MARPSASTLMNLGLLKLLTWSTVVGAVVCALALAAVEPIAPRASQMSSIDAGTSLVLPSEPTAAGPARAAASAADGADALRRAAR